MTVSNPFMRMDATGREKMVVRGLGAAEVTVGGLVLAPDADILFSLAVVLGIRSGERLARTELRQLIWPGIPDESSRHSLRQALYKLHKAGLASEDSAEDIRVAPEDMDCDVADVLKHDWPYRAEPQEIERAAVLLPGYTPDEGSALAEWLETVRSRVSAQYRRATLHRIGSARREGRWREVEHWALMCLQADPLNEEATMARAEAAAMVGAKNEALEILDTFLKELGDRSKVIGLPTRMLKRRISELTDTSRRRITATSAPFVGRHALLATAQDTLAEAGRGVASALWFVGPAGIGKSRLLREVTRAARMGSWTAVHGAAYPSYVDRPFALLTELLPQILDAPGALGAAPHALTLMRQMGKADTGEEPLPPEEARGRQHAVYHSWVDLMEAVLSETPLALFVDDAQWSDPLTLLVFSRFLEAHPKARLSIILSTRRLPTRDDNAAARLLNAAQERVGPLDEEEIRLYTQAVGLGSDAEYEEVTRRLGRASGGNPLFLSHLVHQHQLYGAPAEIPPDLATLIDIQLRTLSKGATRLIQACSLFGRHASLTRVEQALGVRAPELVSPFGELDDMLALPADPGQPLAPHDLWSERVRQGMTSGVFRTLAVSVARVLEADAVADGGIELYWDAARLYQESGEKQLAYGTMMRCAEYLMRTGAAAEASRAYEAASELAVTAEGATRALMGRLRTLRALDDWQEVLPTADRVRELGRLSEEHAASELELIVLSARWALSGSDVSTLPALRAIVSDRTAPSELRLRAAVLGMAVADNAFDAPTIHFFHDAVADVASSAPDDEIARLKISLIINTAIGDLDLALEAASALVGLARRQGSPSTLQEALRYASYPPRRSGDFDCARRRLLEASEVAEKQHLAHSQCIILDMLAGLHLDYDLPDESLRFLEAAESLNSYVDGTFRRRSAADTWALAHLRLGRPDRAARYVRSAQEALAFGRCRAQFVSLSATLLLALSDDRLTDVAQCLEELDQVRDRLFRHAGQDVIAEAYARGLDACRGRDAAGEFTAWYLAIARRDRAPVSNVLASYLPTQGA